MNEAAWKRLVGSVVPASERWAFRGKLAYRKPLSHVLIGVLGEGSGFGGETYVWRVTMPLFVPSQTVVLSWSARMGGEASRFQDDDQDALHKAASRAIANVGDQESQLRSIASRASGSQNLRAAEAAAYALVLLGEPLKHEISLPPPDSPPTDDSACTTCSAECSRSTISSNAARPKEATELLARWEQATASVLRLDNAA